jgi:predicted acyl esterase
MLALVPFTFAIAQASVNLDLQQQGGSGLHGASALVLGSGEVLDVAPVRSVHQVPMSDGTKLNTIVNLPSNYKPGDKLATVLIRTPYNAEGLMNEAPSWCGLGFALVCQDVRGMYASEGEFRMFHDAGYDGHDTVEWITGQPWSNGRVGQTGASALALATYLLLTSHDPPAPAGLQAVAPIVGNAVMHKASFQGGAWRESLMAGWLDAQKGGFVWIPREKAHESFDAYSENTSAYWVVGGLDGFSRARKAAVPGVHTAGWYDIFSWSQIETVHQLNGSWPLSSEPPAASAPQWLVMVGRSRAFVNSVVSRLAGALTRSCDTGTRGPLWWRGN